jgi:hypothetical protein
MPRAPLVASSFLLAGLAQVLLAQPQPSPEFQADSRLSEPYLIGATRSTADKKIVITNEHLLISVESATLALRFPNRESNTVAGENEQLLLLSGTFRNPQKEPTSVPGGTPVLVRIFGGTPGQIYRLDNFFEADSLQHLDVTLKPDQSARYTIVLRVPAEKPTLKISLRRRDGPSRKYDFGPVVKRTGSVFLTESFGVASSAKVSVGQVFDLHALDVNVVSVREVSKAGTYVSSEGKYLYAAELQVTNRMLLPEKWGWQYCTPDLKDASDKTIPWSRDMLDVQTGQTFSKDLGPGETATVLYVFSSDTKSVPRVLRLMDVRTKRHVEISLSPI